MCTAIQTHRLTTWSLSPRTKYHRTYFYPVFVIQLSFNPGRRYSKAYRSVAGFDTFAPCASYPTMEIGTHCALSDCGRLSFLPISCPLCTTTFCESHFLPEQHSCSNASSTIKNLSDHDLLRQLASADSSGRLPCQKSGCKKLSFEVQKQPLDAPTRNLTKTAFTHAAPRCERCKGLFCAAHRSAVSHGCSAPAPMTEGQMKIKAMQERKKKAAEVLAKNFPNRKT